MEAEQKAINKRNSSRAEPSKAPCQQFTSQVLLCQPVNPFANFFTQYPICQGFGFQLPTASALHGQSFSMVGNILVGEYPRKRIKQTRAPRQCIICCKFDGGVGKWVHLCDGKNGRGKCEYFHKDGGVKQSLDVKPKSVQKQEEKEAKKHNNRRAG